jgi:hypothetical protein
MSAAPEREPTELGSAIPEHPAKRDLLGNFCFYFHFAVMGFIVLGWLIPSRPLLFFYLGFLPLVFLQWRVNRDTCILNNIEGWLRTRRWRNPENREEGAWLLTIVSDITGWKITPIQMNIFTNSVLGVLWLLGFSHLKGWILG